MPFNRILKSKIITAMPTPDITYSFSTAGTQLLLLLNFEPSNVLAFDDCPIVFIAVVSRAKCTQTHN